MCYGCSTNRTDYEDIEGYIKSNLELLEQCRKFNSNKTNEMFDKIKDYNEEQLNEYIQKEYKEYLEYNKKQEELIRVYPK